MTNNCNLLVKLSILRVLCNFPARMYSIFHSFQSYYRIMLDKKYPIFGTNGLGSLSKKLIYTYASYGPSYHYEIFLRHNYQQIFFKQI